MPTLSEDLTFRGLIHQMTDTDLPKRFDQPGLTVYAGFDPSADSLHVGNLMQLCTLRRFQEAGHRPISLAGGGTGMIGDPGGKQDERQLLDLETIEGYLEGIRPQLGQFLDLDDDRALLLNNADWLSTLSTLEYLRDVGKHFTVNQMVAKESVKTRFERPDQGISYTEFSYMLLQAYDFLRLHLDHGCDLQFGGSDQWGNITMGVDFVRKVCGDEVWGFTTPLIVKPDGTKYGKTESGTVWLDPKRTSPFAMYQFFLNTPDEQVGELLRFLTFLDHEEITDARPPDGGAAAAPRGAAGAGPGRHRAGPRRGRGGQVRGGVGRPLRRGDRRAQRGDAARRHRGRADDDRPQGGAARRPHPRRRPRAHRPGQVQEGGAAHRRAGRRLRQQRPADAMTGAPSRPATSCTTATSCCARANEVHIVRAT